MIDRENSTRKRRVKSKMLVPDPPEGGRKTKALLTCRREEGEMKVGEETS